MNQVLPKDQWVVDAFPHLQDVSPLGSGGQKLVFSAIDRERRRVVLKVFFGAATHERSLREIEAISKLSSNRVPALIDWGVLSNQTGNVLWLIEQRIDGSTLRDLRAVGPLPESVLLVTALHVLEAIVTAVDVSLIHRDIKPDNIIWANLDSSAWLIDFGIARHLDKESLTDSGNVFGPCTFGYASPEQIQNEKDKIDERSDLFSLGVTLYEMVAGQNPLLRGASGPLEVAQRTINDPLQRIEGGISSEFSGFIHALTRIRVDHRPKSAREAYDWIIEIAQ